MNSHLIRSEYSSGMAFTTLLNGHAVITDSGVTDKGPRPKALMLLALSGCTGIDVVNVLTKMRVPFSDLTIDIKGDLTDEDPVTYHTMKITYTIKIAETDRARMERSVALSLDKCCGVAAMFRKFATLEKEIVYL